MRRQKLAAGSLLLTLLFLTTAGNSYAFKNEPEGFRGIQWGDSPSALKNGKKVYSKDNVEYYIKLDDVMQIGSATVSNVVYEFWHGKFATALIETEGHKNWSRLKETVFERFGNGKKPKRFMEKYIWGSPYRGKSYMLLKYSEIKKKGVLYIFSKEIWKQRKGYDKPVAKEGAAKGF
ncbi:hypothetical protein OO006_04225 [Prosthecochloris sp. SCSIO W1101]|uniref:hypothetical protein n=1 Tax=Prosthecochloris sp. SCSIO W1101 TaxID=2992242 RepID=UPI00223D14AB|nr:hypothetical protein [Prosthecochloris sp. SCSIO W1101]UZJ42187.1 hypothetical protein OO006_04225 [Prosthecochloris sp. SCSIO W1101]